MDELQHALICRAFGRQHKQMIREKNQIKLTIVQRKKQIDFNHLLQFIFISLHIHCQIDIKDK